MHRERILAIGTRYGEEGLMLGKTGNNQDKNDECEKNWRVGGHDAFNSRWLAIFVLLLFGYLIFVALDISIALKILALLFVWWFVLAAFWVLPIFSYFDAEKWWIVNFRTNKINCIQKQMVSMGFYVVYWPIFIPKELFFWAFVLIVIACYFIE